MILQKIEGNEASTILHHTITLT